MERKRGEGENVHLLVVVDDLAPIWPVTVLIITSISIKSIVIASHEKSKSIAKDVVLIPINMNTKYKIPQSHI